MSTRIFLIACLLMAASTITTYAQSGTGRRVDAPVETVTNAPDQIEMGKDGKDNFKTLEEVYNFYKTHPDHKNDAKFTLANLKKWNPALVSGIKRGQHIWLVPPPSKSGSALNKKP